MVAAECGYVLLPHEAYLPDLAPSDFYLFPQFKEHLSGRQYASDNHIIQSVEDFLEMQDELSIRPMSDETLVARVLLDMGLRLVHRSCRNDGIHPSIYLKSGNKAHEQVQYSEKDRQKGQRTKQTPKYVQEPKVNTKC